MANSNGWGDGAANNSIGWGQGANNNIGWGDSHAKSWAGLTDIVGLTTDADAQAFITAAAITDATQKSAIDTLVKGMKADGIWTKMKAIYPFVGGTASTHKWNLKDPRDLNAAYRLTFSGGWTHNANGITGNGVNAYADTWNNTAFSLGAYSRISNSGVFTGYVITVEDGDGIPSNQFGNILSGSSVFSQFYSISTGSGPYTKTYSVIDTNSVLPNSVKIYRNGADINATSISTASPWVKGFANYALGAVTVNDFDNGMNLINSGIQSYSTANLAFIYFSDSILNATQNANLNTRIVAFQTALSRNV